MKLINLSAILQIFLGHVLKHQCAVPELQFQKMNMINVSGTENRSQFSKKLVFYNTVCPSLKSSQFRLLARLFFYKSRKDLDNLRSLLCLITQHLRDHSLTTLTKFCPLLPTYLPRVDIGKGINSMLQGDVYC